MFHIGYHKSPMTETSWDFLLAINIAETKNQLSF